ncbi:MAG: MFS family permease [Bradymonadia bacterium]|jgi:MFS family permease
MHSSHSEATHPVTRWLESTSPAILTVYAVVVSFTTYFCMYAFRKPFSAASYESLDDGSGIEWKTAFVVSQVIGYTISKYMGIKVCAELPREKRAAGLFALIGIGFAALFFFAVLPPRGKVVAIFVNGLPLGMVWGLIVTFLEGRRTSEMMMAGLSCSYILASGVVKDVGRWLMSAHQVSEFWMPFTTGLVFLPVFIISVYGLSLVPKPDAADERERHERTEMDGKERSAFAGRFLWGLVMLLILYFFLTAFRDFRDNFGVEMFEQLGLGDQSAIFSRAELPVAFGVLIVFAALTFVRDNRRGFLVCYGIMLTGLAIVAGATGMLQLGRIDGLSWMIAIGFGSYLAYVPFGSVLFDRLMAYTRAPGTAVFAIYLCDAVGYTGSTALMLSKDALFADVSRLDFFIGYCWFTSAIGSVLFVASAVFFVRRTK